MVAIVVDVLASHESILDNLVIERRIGQYYIADLLLWSMDLVLASLE